MNPIPTLTPTGTEAEVCADIARRQEHGRVKYGQTVAENPLTTEQWLQHLYEELLDGAVYAKRLMPGITQPTADLAARDALIGELRAIAQGEIDQWEGILAREKLAGNSVKEGEARLALGAVEGLALTILAKTPADADAKLAKAVVAAAEAFDEQSPMLRPRVAAVLDFMRSAVQERDALRARVAEAERQARIESDDARRANRLWEQAEARRVALVTALKPFASAHDEWSGADAIRYFGSALRPAQFRDAALALSEGVPAPFFDLLAHLRRQQAFSVRTFGPGQRTTGVLAHIRKELVEIEAAPTDLSEWIDVVLLAFDGAWRHGGTPESIVAALAAKQTKNEGRTWPDWRAVPEGEAICHVKTSCLAAPAQPPTT